MVVDTVNSTCIENSSSVEAVSQSSTYAVRDLAKFMSSYGHAHWAAAKHLLRYLQVVVVDRIVVQSWTVVHVNCDISPGLCRYTLCLLCCNTMPILS